MENSHFPLTEDQIQSYNEKGYLVIQGFFNAPETKLLQRWTQEVHDLPRTPDASYMPYEVGDSLKRTTKVQSIELMEEGRR